MAVKSLHARITELLRKCGNGQVSNRKAAALEPRPLEPDLRDRIDVWVNEGGAGGEVNR
ncbi:hypothetical protein BH11PSE3_BH11PSE3_29080 [soil metagenome]